MNVKDVGLVFFCHALNYTFFSIVHGWVGNKTVSSFWDFPGLFQCLILIPAKLSDIALQRLFVECLTPMLPFVQHYHHHITKCQLYLL